MAGKMVMDKNKHTFAMIGAPLHRLQLTTLINNDQEISNQQTIVKIGSFHISTEYIKKVKKYYFDVNSLLRYDDYEISVQIEV